MRPGILGSKRSLYSADVGKKAEVEALAGRALSQFGFITGQTIHVNGGAHYY